MTGNDKNLRDITLLDCTLRDGGHLTGGYFGKNVIEGVIRRLSESGTDIIEVGFLVEEQYSSDYARYRCIKDLKKVLPCELGDSKIALMADFVDLSGLEEYDGTVEYVRLSFKRHRLDWALRTAGILAKKGYKCFINPVNINVYSDSEILQVIERVNNINPYGFSIVDTFGVLRKRDLLRLEQLLDYNLNEEIVLGVHLHENLALSYTLAQSFIEMKNPKRKINIDGSLLGMGREPGNLHLELIMCHLNDDYGAHYDTEPVFDAIDDYIQPLHKIYNWGYKIPYALSAEYKLHRTYAEYLMSKWKIKTHDVKRILEKVEKDKSEFFDEDYIEKLYREYMEVPFNDSGIIESLKAEFDNFNGVMVVAPGSTIISQKNEIKSYISKSENLAVVSVNFIPDDLEIDYMFFSNAKRFETSGGVSSGRMICTSNMIPYVSSDSYIISYKKLAYHDSIFNDDSTLMFLNLLCRMGIGDVSIAGFDGFLNGEKNFFNEIFDRKLPGKKKTESVKEVLKQCYQDKIAINFITKSLYDGL